MVINSTIESGVPTRIYRTLGEIRRDINVIRERIESTDEQLNIRSLLLEVLSGAEYSTPELLIPELYEAIAEAKSALSSLTKLKEELLVLEEELEETRCVIGN
jgi:hypothetical protein